MSPRENISSDSEQIEKARQDLLLACREAADRAQQEQEQQRERELKQQKQEREQQEQKQKSFSEPPQKPQETPSEVNFETPKADEESVIAIEQAGPDEIEQSVPAETDETPLTVQRQRQKTISSYRDHNPFVADLLKGIVSEDIDRLRRQLADKP